MPFAFDLYKRTSVTFVTVSYAYLSQEDSSSQLRDLSQRSQLYRLRLFVVTYYSLLAFLPADFQLVFLELLGSLVQPVLMVFQGLALVQLAVLVCFAQHT